MSFQHFKDVTPLPHALYYLLEVFSLSCVFFYIMCLFILDSFKIFSLLLFQQFEDSSCVGFFVFILLEMCCTPWLCGFIVFTKSGNFLGVIFSNIFYSLLPSDPSGIPLTFFGRAKRLSFSVKL